MLATMAGAETKEEPPPYDIGAYLQSLLVNVYVFAAVGAIARDVSSTPLNIQRRTRVDGQIAWEKDEDHELTRLFERSNPTQNISDLLELSVMATEASGDGYIMHEPKDNELYYVQPDWVKIGTNGGEIASYVIKNRGRTVQGDLDRIIHFKSANPLNAYYGLTPIKTIEQSILSKLHLNKYLNAFFKNNGVLGTILSTEQELTEEQTTILLKQFNKLHKGSNEAFRAALFSNGLKASQLVSALKELIPVEINDMVVQEVCTAFGVPAIKLGITKDATLNHSTTQDAMYEKGTVEPRRRKIERAITRQFIQVHYGEEYRCRFDRSEVQGLQEDQNEKTKRLSTQWKDGVITRNEYREDIGRDPDEDDDLGNEYYRAPAPVQYQPGNDAGESAGEKSTPSGRKSVDDPYVALWKAHEKKLKKEEKPYAQHVADFFEAQYKRLIANIEEITGKGAMPSRLKLHLTKDDDALPKTGDALFDLQAENALLSAEMAPVIREVIERSGQETISRLAIDLGFNVHNPSVELVIETFRNRIKIINESTYKDIKKILLDAYDSGEGVDVVARRLREKYDFFSKTRSKTIARTEMNGIVSAGAHNARLQVMQSTGLHLQKQWIATRDANVRSQHIHADLQIREITEAYDVGGDRLMFPGDPSGNPGNVINCRCTDYEIIKDESQ